MTTLHQHYGPADGPLGFPMTDKQAFALESLLKNVPKEPAYAYRHAVVEKATTELSPGERADVSWITTEDPDRTKEVVLSRGMNDSQFKLNPLVTMQHSYWLPPVGKSVWRKRVSDGPLVGIKAKTQYPQKPDAWPADDWPPDVAFGLVQSQLLNGKSIGFLPLKVHAPTDKEVAKNNWKDVSLVIDEWLLLEYACCYIPCQQNAVVEAVSKAAPPPFLKAMGLDALPPPPPTPPAIPAVIPFITLDEIGKALGNRLSAIDPAEIVRARVDQKRGRV